MSETWSTDAPSWLDRLYYEDEFEEAENFPEPIKLLLVNGRKVVWGLCGKMTNLQVSDGVPGMACQLFERYLAAYVRRHSYMSPLSSEWRRVKSDIMHKLLLLVAVCIQLTTKMTSAHSYINASSLKITLQREGYICTLQDITIAEADVFKSLGFRIPLWTNAQTAQMLARELGMTDTLLDAVVLIMDITEHRRSTLQEHLQSIAIETPSSATSGDSEAGPSSSSSTLGVGNVRNMHMVAGVVAATGRFLRYTGPDPIPRLAIWTRSSEAYITCICNVILNHVINLDDYNQMVAKRQSESTTDMLPRKRQRCN